MSLASIVEGIHSWSKVPRVGLRPKDIVAETSDSIRKTHAEGRKAKENYRQQLLSGQFLSLPLPESELVTREEINTRRQVCTQCIAIQGEHFDYNECVGCTDGLVVLLDEFVQ